MSNILLWLRQRIKHWLKPTTVALISGLFTDLARSRTEFVPVQVSDVSMHWGHTPRKQVEPAGARNQGSAHAAGWLLHQIRQ